MFRKFTQRACNAVLYAQEASQIENHPGNRHQHTALGLLREGEGIGAKALKPGCGFGKLEKKLPKRSERHT